MKTRFINQMLALFILICLLNRTPLFAQGSWSPVKAGLNAQALTMTEYGGDLYIGKLNFSTPDEINKWDGVNLLKVGTGTNGPVGAFSILDNKLYVGGGFSSAGGKSASDVATWDGTKWTAVGDQLDNFCINAMAFYNNELYVGGYGVNASMNALAAFTIAKWNGSKWIDVGSGLQGGNVFCMAIYNNELYAGGSFTNSGSATVSHIAKWDGKNWSSVATSPIDGTVIFALKVYNGELYAGGDFTTIGGINSNCIAKWDGNNWSKIGNSSGTDNTVVALFADNNSLYIGGAFSNAGDISANHIAKWDGTNWSALGEGIGSINNPNDQVWCISSYKNDIYAAGTFTTAGGVPANNIARWSVNSGIRQIPDEINMVQVFPNPVNKNSVLEFSAAHRTLLNIDVYDLAGHKVLGLFNGEIEAGIHQYSISGTQKLNKGLYIVKIVSNGEVSTARICIQ